MSEADAKSGGGSGSSSGSELAGTIVVKIGGEVVGSGEAAVLAADLRELIAGGARVAIVLLGLGLAIESFAADVSAGAESRARAAEMRHAEGASSQPRAAETRHAERASAAEAAPRKAHSSAAACRKAAVPAKAAAAKAAAAMVDCAAVPTAKEVG